MGYRTLLWLLCICYAFAELVEQNSTEESSYLTIEEPTGIEEENVTTTTTARPEDVEGTTSAQTTVIPKVESNLDETGKPRDKRTLNLILRGLANILGYTVSPIQLASIPNLQPTLPALPPAPLPKALNPVTMPPWPPLPPPAAAPAPKVPTPPPPSVPQKETVKLTGVVNFGNNPDLLGHLVQYEEIFHGSGAASPAPKPAPKPPIGPPILIQIPNPIAPNLPPPLLPAPAPRPTQPLPLIPRKLKYEKEYRNNENLENYKVENKELRNEKEVTKVIPTGSKYKHDLYIGEPHWKKHYEDRLTELEKKQIEYAERLKQYEEKKKKSEPNEYADYEDATSNNRHREKEIADRDRVYAERSKEEEEEEEEEEGQQSDYREKDRENSRERDQDGDTPFYEGYSRPRQYEDDEEESQRYRDYDGDEAQPSSKNTDETEERSVDYKDAARKLDDYEDKAPVVDDNGSKSRSAEVRNSYGETLENRGQVDENISDYFGKFKNPRTGVYESERIQNSENERKEEPWWEESQKGSNENVEENERVYASPAPESKYEEYNLDEAPDGTNSRVSDKLEDLNENVEPGSPDYSEAFGSYEPYSRKAESEDKPSTSGEPSKNVKLLQNEDSQSDVASTKKNERLEEEKEEASKEIPYDEFDLTNYKPYYAPVKYIYNPDELDRTTTKILSTYENASQSKSEDEEPEDDHGQSESSSEEDLTPKIGLPQKLTTKSLHEGETKEFQVWPAPFDYVFDSTEQTNVAEVPSTPESKVSPYRGPTYERAYQQPLRHEDYTQGQFGEGSRQPETADHSYPRDTNRNDVERAQEPRSHVPSQSDDFRSEAPRDDLQDERVTQERSGPEDEQQQRTEHLSEPDDRNEQQSSYPDDYLARYRYGFEDQNSHGEESPRIELQNYSPEEQEQHVYHSSESQPQGAKSHHSSTAQSPPNALPTEYGSSSKESVTDKPDFYYSQAEPHVYGRRFDKNAAAGTEKAALEATSPAPKKLENTGKFEDPSSAHDYFGFSKDDYRLEGENKAPEVSHAVEGTPASTKDGDLDLLTVPDPPSYKYDEKLTEFTDVPESDTEKVKVKEYRNKVATVKVSELKQLSPNGPVQLIGYTRNF